MQTRTVSDSRRCVKTVVSRRKPGAWHGVEKPLIIGDAMVAQERRRRPPRLFRQLATLGLTSFGGSPAYLQTLVDDNEGLTSAQYLEGLSLVYCLPGATFSNLGVYVGQLLAGPGGAASAFLLLVLPGALTIAVLSALFLGTALPPALVAGLRAAGAATVGLAFVSCLQVVGRARGSRGAPLSGVLAFLLAGPLGLGLVPALLLAGGFSVWANRPRGRG